MPGTVTMLMWFLMASSFVLLLFLIFSRRSRRVSEAQSADTNSFMGSPGFPMNTATPAMHSRADRLVTQRLESQEKKQELKARMVHAGLYRRNASYAFLLARAIMVISLVGLGIGISLLGLLPLWLSTLIGVFAGLTGTVAPSFWLDHVKRVRQTKIRRALPDALDVIAICLEGGLSLSAALSRVARELGSAHPLLATELMIVEREAQMGLTTGEAMREFANRFDLEELRSLSSVIRQAERFGSSVTRALEVYAETLRLKRHQRAEELAQKAAIKILFPTALLIFPGIFVVILGPAVIRIYQVFFVDRVLGG